VEEVNWSFLMTTNYSDWLHILENTEPRSARIADRAFEKLAKERMPPTPENYALWYTYFAGYQPDLNRVIDQMMKAGQPFTPLRCEDLVKRFFLLTPKPMRCVRPVTRLRKRSRKS